MSQKSLAALLSDYFKRVGLVGSVDRVLHGAPLEVNGVLIALDWQQDRMPNLGFAHADVAAIPQEHAEAIYRFLLSTNMLLHPTTGCAITVSPRSDRILLAANFSLENTDAEKLEHILKSMAKAVLELREHLLQYSDEGQT